MTYAGAAAVLLLTAGCGGGADEEESRSSHRVLSAGVTLPENLTWTERIVERDSVDSHRYSAELEDGSGCWVELSVQDATGETKMDRWEELERLWGEEAVYLEDDLSSPNNAEGLKFRGELPIEGTDGTSIVVMRVWFAPESVLYLSVNTVTEPAPACDPEAIAETLVWDGAPRAADDNG